MRVELTDEQHLLLELISEQPLPAIPEIARYTGGLAAGRLIELTAEMRWKVTRRGEAVPPSEQPSASVPTLTLGTAR
jgi:hypothetical protein